MPEPSSFRRAAQLCAVLAVCAALRIWLIDHTEVISRDGTLYVQMAREWVDNPRAVIDGYNLHVGYPAAMVFAHRLLSMAGLAQSPLAWELAGQVVSAVASVTAMAAVWLFAGWAFNWRIAWISALLFGIGRKWSVLGADVLTDAPAVCFQLWAVVLAMLAGRFLERRNKWSLLLATGVGFCAGVGYLVRPEALLVAGVGIVFWLWLLLRRRSSWRLTFACSAVTVLVTAACAAPYMMAIGGLTKKKSISEITIVPAEQSLTPPRLPGNSAEQYSALHEFVRRFSEAIFPVLAIFLAVYLVILIGKKVLRLKLPGQILIFASPEGTFLMTVIVAGFGLMIIGLYLNVGYMSERHLMFPAAIVSCVAGVGYLITLEWIILLAKRLHLPQRIGRLIMPVATVVLVLGMLADSLTPVNEGKSHFRQAAYFVGELAGPNDYILADSRWIMHYAWVKNPQVKSSYFRAATLSWQMLLEQIERTSASHLVVRDRGPGKSGWGLIQRLESPAFVQIEQFPKGGTGRRDVIHVYRINHKALPRSR